MSDSGKRKLMFFLYFVALLCVLGCLVAAGYSCSLLDDRSPVYFIAALALITPAVACLQIGLGLSVDLRSRTEQGTDPLEEWRRQDESAGREWIKNLQ